MVTVILILAIVAFVAWVWAAMGRATLIPAVGLICVLELIRDLPLGK